MPITQETVNLAAAVEGAVEYGVKNDDELYALVERLNQALETRNEKALLELARKIRDHAAGLYGPVVSAADDLVVHLGG